MEREGARVHGLTIFDKPANLACWAEAQGEEMKHKRGERRESQSGH